MRLIDADALMDAVDGNPLTTDSLKEYVRSTVKAQPTVDAVPVIRCKDCKWYEQDIGCDWGVCFHDDWVHKDVGHGVDGDGYCYRAERKEHGTD